MLDIIVAVFELAICWAMLIGGILVIFMLSWIVLAIGFKLIAKLFPNSTLSKKINKCIKITITHE